MSNLLELQSGSNSRHVVNPTPAGSLLPWEPLLTELLLLGKQIGHCFSKLSRSPWSAWHVLAGRRMI